MKAFKNVSVEFVVFVSEEKKEFANSQGTNLIFLLK